MRNDIIKQIAGFHEAGRSEFPEDAIGLITVNEGFFFMRQPKRFRANVEYCKKLSWINTIDIPEYHSMCSARNIGITTVKTAGSDNEQVKVRKI